MEQAVIPRIHSRFSRLALSEELSLLEMPRSRVHGNRDLHRRLAVAYAERDRLDEAIPLLQSLCESADDADACRLLADCFLSRETEAGNRSARDYAQRAVVAASDPRRRASALAALGKAQLRLGETDDAPGEFCGSLAPFPSHCYHRTFPYRGGSRRICFAFDVSALSEAERAVAH